jgi:hypothetical protein
MSVLGLPYRFMLGRGDLLPLCDVYLIGPATRALVTALIDSGAVYPVFPERAAEDAGITLPKVRRFTVQYGGGTSAGTLARVYIELVGRRWETDIVFVERLDPPYALLGRRGVFARFNEIAFLERVPTPRVELRW